MNHPHEPERDLRIADLLPLADEMSSRILIHLAVDMESLLASLRWCGDHGIEIDMSYVPGYLRRGDVPLSTHEPWAWDDCTVIVGVGPGKWLRNHRSWRDAGCMRQLVEIARHLVREHAVSAQDWTSIAGRGERLYQTTHHLSYGATPLAWAAASGKEAHLLKHVRERCGPDRPDRLGRTALHHVVLAGVAWHRVQPNGLISELERLGVDPRARDAWGLTYAAIASLQSAGGQDHRRQEERQ